MLTLYQIDDIVIHWHPSEADEIDVSVKTENAHGDALNFYWSEAEFKTAKKKVSGYLLHNSRDLPSETLIRRLKGLIGRHADLIAYDSIDGSDLCCCFCGSSNQEYLWLHTMGVVTNVTEEWDDKVEAYSLELEIEHNPVWIPVNRFFWDYRDTKYNLFSGICFNQDNGYGDDLCTGGTASASSTNGGNAAANAFDNNNATYWQSTDTALPHWLEYNFGTPVTIRRYTLTPQSQIEGWTLEYYDGTAWQVADQRAWQPLWGIPETRTFDFHVDYTASRWRIRITANGEGLTQVGMYEMTMHALSSPASDNYAAQMDGYPRGYLNNRKFWARKNYQDEFVAYRPDLWAVQHGLLRDSYPLTGYGTGWRQGTHRYSVAPDGDIWSATPHSMYAFTNLSGGGIIIIDVKRQTSAWGYDERRSLLSLDSLANAMLPYGGLLTTDILIIGDVFAPPGFIIRGGYILADEVGRPLVVPEINLSVPFGRLGRSFNSIRIQADENLWAAIHTFRRF